RARIPATFVPAAAVAVALVVLLLVRQVRDGPHEAVPPTTPTTTTRPTSTPATAAPTFASETAHLAPPTPSLARAIVVASGRVFETAVAEAKRGQVIDVGGDVRIPGEFTGFDRVISGGSVDVVFEPGATFTGTPGANLAAVWLKNSGGWRIWGGTITTQ